MFLIHCDNPKFFGQVWVMISCKWLSPEIRVAKASKINTGYVSITAPLIVSVTLLEYENNWIRPALCLVSAAKAGCLVNTVKIDHAPIYLIIFQQQARDFWVVQSGTSAASGPVLSKLPLALSEPISGSAFHTVPCHGNSSLCKNHFKSISWLFY